MNATRSNIFDSSPLSAFCLVGRLDLLEARWTAPVSVDTV